MPNVTFTFGGKDDLTVHTGADQFEWTYKLNTKPISTYGGQVIQILSAYVDDIVITGTTRTVYAMETIYGWFIDVMNRLSQGAGDSMGNLGEAAGTSFATGDMGIFYPERGWHFGAFPRQLPGLKYDRDTATAHWQVVCAVVEGDASVNNITLNKAQLEAMKNQFRAVDVFGQMSADVGFRYDNPFVSINTAYGQDFNAQTAQKVYQPMVDFYLQNILQAYSQGQLQGLDVNFATFGSKPTPPPAPGAQGGGPESDAPPADPGTPGGPVPPGAGPLVTDQAHAGG